MDVPRGRVVVYSDIGCPWAHVAVFRLHKTRAMLGLDDEVVFEHRSFPLELFNERPTPRKVLDAEIPVAGALEPEAGWQMWRGPDYHYPVTMLPALEAVHAARAQSERAAEQLDRALRVAFFGASEIVSMRHVILGVAKTCDQVDGDALADALDSGRFRRALMDDYEKAQSDEVNGSPHVFVNGEDAHNPGIQMHWEGDHGKGFPVVDKDDPSIYQDLLERAAR
ncbi:MAG TPA: DsbA family protein [Actinomycetota bacterium]|jgi:predicted DsbA family dithiol-disulfide isomerase